MDQHLGGQTGPPLQTVARQTSTFWFSAKVASVIVLVIFGYAVVLRAWNSFLRHQEKSYRLYARLVHLFHLQLTLYLVIQGNEEEVWHSRYRP